MHHHAEHKQSTHTQATRRRHTRILILVHAQYQEIEGERLLRSAPEHDKQHKKKESVTYREEKGMGGNRLPNAHDKRRLNETNKKKEKREEGRKRLHPRKTSSGSHHMGERPVMQEIGKPPHTHKKKKIIKRVVGTLN